MQEAFSKLASDVSVPAFMEKLASFGYGPADKEAADTMLKSALRVDSIINTVHQAIQQSTPDYTKLASEALLGKEIPQAEIDNLIKESADFLNVDGVRDAALAYRAALINS